MAAPESAETRPPSPFARMKAWLTGADEAHARGGFAKPVYPEAFDNGHSHRRLVWTARALAIAVVFEGLAICAMAFAFSSLVPLKTVQMGLLQVSPATEMVYEVKPLRADMPVMDYMTRAWVREYVLTRNAIVADNEAMQGRMRWVRERSSVPVFREFVDKQKDFLARALAERLVRNVEIKAVTRDRQRVAVWFVDFITTDTTAQGQASQRQWRAQLIVSYEPRLTRAGDLDVREIDNPFGFTVQRYDVGGLSAEPAN